MKVIWTLLAGLVLVLAPGTAGFDDHPAGICVGGLQIRACVPPESEAG
ncbi:MAG: hypothetical protein AB1679_26640 [Actinomycetota bacterium]|jgi:hypothetical protein